MTRKTLTLIAATMLLPCVAFNQSAQLKGRVALAGMPAPLAAHDASPARNGCAPQLANAALVYGKKLELQNVAVFLANVKSEKLPPQAVGMEIANCLYQPRVSAVLHGDTLVLRSRDAATHHARGYFRAFARDWSRVVTKDILAQDSSEVFNVIFRKPNTTAWETLDTPGLLEIRSEAGEPWLKSYVFVLPHRFFAITNDKGEFEFKDLPPGKYDLVLWHEMLGLKRQLVELSAEQKSEQLITWEIGASTPPDSSSSQAQK